MPFDYEIHDLDLVIKNLNADDFIQPETRNFFCRLHFGSRYGQPYPKSCAPVAGKLRLIAKKRGLDPEIAAMAAMLHDLHAYKTGSYDDHAHLSADLAREILGELKLTDEAETDMICSAIYHHDDKLVTDSPMDEVLKDADVIHHCMNDLSKAIKEKEQARYDKLCAEFGM